MLRRQRLPGLQLVKEQAGARAGTCETTLHCVCPAERHAFGFICLQRMKSFSMHYEGIVSYICKHLFCFLSFRFFY